MESERASPLSPGGPRQSAPYGHACVACAKAKCKCITRGPAGSTGSCERCTRLGRECRPSTSHRKRQVGVGGGGGGVDNRKAGSPRRSERDRTAQLEEKLEDLVRVLRAQAEAGEGANEERGSGRGRRKGSERSGDGFGPGTAMIMDELRGGAPMMASVTPIQDGASRHNPYIAARDKPTTADLMLTPAESTSPRAACGGGSSTAASSPVTASEIPSLSTVQAEETLALFREQYLRIFPFMHITPETSAATLQRERPYLWLNIRTLLAKSPLQQSALSLRCREILATKVFVDLERNMDLVLGLLVYAGWTMNHFCGKPLVVAAMNMGITLVGDLRLDRPIQDHPSKESNCFRNYTYPKCATGAVRTHEERRAVLAMWVVSLNVSMFLRCQSMRWTPHMDDCLRKLDTHPEWHGDEMLVFMVKIHKVLDDVAQMTWRSHSSEDSTSQKAPAMIYVKTLRQSLQQIKDTLPESLVDNKIALSYLYSTDMIISDMPFWNNNPFTSPQASRPSHLATSPRSPDLSRLEAYYSLFANAKAVLTNYLSFLPVDIVGFSFIFILHFFRSTQVLYRLTLTEDADWDHGIVQENFDLLGAIEQAAKRYAQVAGIYGLQTERDGAGNEVTDFFTKCANALRATVPVWRAALGHKRTKGIHAAGGTSFGMNVGAGEGQGPEDSTSGETLPDTGGNTIGPDLAIVGGSMYGAPGSTDQMTPAIAGFQEFLPMDFAMDDAWWTELVGSWDPL